MHKRDIVVVGASAGGVRALMQLVGDLPPAIPASVCVVLHLARHGVSALASILARASRLPCLPAAEGVTLEHGHIYTAPPDYHLLLEDGGNGSLRLSRAPEENRHRPAVDVLFRSAARAFGARVIGVVLSGALADGTAGLAVIKAHGGLAVVQSPADALYPSMPNSAIANVEVDHVVEVQSMGALLARLCSEDIQSLGY